jgi:hypothetical protein
LILALNTDQKVNPEPAIEVNNMAKARGLLSGFPKTHEQIASVAKKIPHMRAARKAILKRQ